MSQTKEEQALMELLALMAQGGQGEFQTPQTQQVNPMSEIANETLGQYVMISQVIPAALPLIEEIVKNVKTLQPLYTEFKEFLRSEIQGSVLEAFVAAKAATNNNDSVALELTKLIVNQNNRMSENLSKNVQAKINGDN